MKKYFLQTASLAIVLFSTSTWAQFIPVPTLEESPLRLFVGVDDNNTWSPFALQQLQGNASAVMGLGMGFDFGINLHGGVGQDKGLFTAGNAMQGLIGGDIMLRYLTNVTDFLYLGLQAQGGYMQNLSMTPMTPNGASIPVDAGLVLGLTFADVVHLYANPAFEFGRKSPADEAKWFGSLIGLNIAAGLAIDMGGTTLVLQGKPRWANLSDASNTFNTAFLVGLAWDL